jgi:hypothetical protein
MPLRISYLEESPASDEAASQEEESEKEKLFSFRLNGFRFYCSTKAGFDMWTNSLKKVTVQNDFHERFHPIKVLGEGSTAKVDKL